MQSEAAALNLLHSFIFLEKNGTSGILVQFIIVIILVIKVFIYFFFTVVNLLIMDYDLLRELFFSKLHCRERIENVMSKYF